MTVKVAVIFYSATGTVHTLALAGSRIADGAPGDGNARATRVATTSQTT